MGKMKSPGAGSVGSDDTAPLAREEDALMERAAKKVKLETPVDEDPVLVVNREKSRSKGAMACVPCWRARKKCVREPGVSSCKRCVKHGKKCISRENGMIDLKQFERKKPSACEACHIGRRKCEFEEGKRRCKRCEATGKVCLLRAVLRGKARKVREYETPLSFAIGRTDVLANYRSIMQMVSAYQELGHKEAPIFILFLLRALGHAALVTGSTARLQSVATLALRAGVDFNLDDIRSLPEQQIDLTPFELEIDQRFFHGIEGGACFIERAYLGKREVKANPTYASMFSTSGEIAADHLKPTDCPYQMAWRKFVHADDEVCSMFMTEVSKAALSSELNKETGVLEYSCTSSEMYDVEDRYGNVFKAHLFAHGLLAHEGAIGYFTFGFKKAECLDPVAVTLDFDFNFEDEMQPFVPLSPSHEMEWEALDLLLNDEEDVDSTEESAAELSS